MTSQVHRLRRQLRASLTSNALLTGTFVKLPSPDVVEICAGAGFSFIVVDMEHSTLSEGDAVQLVRHADLCALPALVRVPEVDFGLVNRLLENGAAGIQLSMLDSAGLVRDLRDSTRFAPHGRRSLSLANRVARMDNNVLQEHLDREGTDPPVLVGQIESVGTAPLSALVNGLDVCFVGTSDLQVSLGPDREPADLFRAVEEIRSAASQAGVPFGGWVPSLDQQTPLGLADARYLIVGSDVQVLAAGLKKSVLGEEPGR
jgi:4-hydroxy-2-oxoheptanedioate aldolase